MTHTLVVLAHGGGNDSSSISATFWVALIAAAAALAAAGIAYRGVRATNYASRAQADRDYVLKQLNELYGPLLMMRSLSARLWKQLPGGVAPEPGVTQWRLIDHIEEIQAESDPRRSEVVEEILKIDKAIADLFTSKAGLFEAIPPPDSFINFLEHDTTIRMLWLRGRNGTDESRKPFPNTLDNDINDMMTRLRTALKAKK